MKVMLNRKLIAVATGLMMVAAIPAAGLAADTIKIGVAGPHSGDLASYGLPSVNAAKIVADKEKATQDLRVETERDLLQVRKAVKTISCWAWPMPFLT